LGLPPTVLFYTKFSILTFLTNNNYIWYIYLFLLLSALSSFYYIRLIKIIVFDKETKNLLEIKSNPVSNFFLLILLILLLSIMCNSIFIQWIYQFFFFQLKIVSLDIDYYIDFFKFIENNDFNINLNNILINIDNIKQIFIYIFNIYDSISSEYLNKHKIWFSFWIDEEIIKMFKKEK
jgi:NADH:ubiquinone oxidoreductase subunit 5 (subunit L)/multisubunit Na+/H+ antiporter MnhA subunit